MDERSRYAYRRLFEDLGGWFSASFCVTLFCSTIFVPDPSLTLWRRIALAAVFSPAATIFVRMLMGSFDSPPFPKGALMGIGAVVCLLMLLRLIQVAVWQIEEHATLFRWLLYVPVGVITLIWLIGCAVRAWRPVATFVKQSRVGRAALGGAIIALTIYGWMEIFRRVWR